MIAITSHRVGDQGLGHGQSLPRIVTAETVTTGAGGHAPIAGGRHTSHDTANICTVTVRSGHLCWCMLCSACLKHGHALDSGHAL